MSIGRLARGQEGYYLAAVARGAEDYYVGPGEAPGVWIGGGAADIDLSGEVSGDDLVAVLAGSDPVSGVSIGHAGRKVPGFDLTFSALDIPNLRVRLKTAIRRLVRLHLRKGDGIILAVAAVWYLLYLGLFIRILWILHRDIVRHHWIPAVLITGLVVWSITTILVERKVTEPPSQVGGSI